MSAHDTPTKMCAALDAWAQLRINADREVGDDKGFERSWREVRMQIGKSCLLDRMLYQGEQPSKTPCPVHKGRWSGCHIGWPGQKWADGKPVDESSQCRAWYDAGCRCYKYSCGCTTGWQPDEHCGCGVKP